VELEVALAEIADVAAVGCIIHLANELEKSRALVVGKSQARDPGADGLERRACHPSLLRLLLRELGHEVAEGAGCE
jgi:hypothetical protein